MATPSLLDWIMDLLRNDEAREAFNSNPQAALQSAGFSQVCGEDVADARMFVADTPGVKQGVLGEFLPEETDDAADNIRYIINNYYYDNDRYIINADEDLEEIDDIDDLDDDDDNGFDFDLDPDGNDQDVDQEDNDRVVDSTVTDSNLGTQDSFNPSINDSFDPTATDSFNNDSSEGQTTVDQSGSTVGDDQIGRDNIEGNVGGDSLGTGNVVVGDDAAGRDMDDQEAGLAALDHVVETGDVHVLSDLVNTDDVARNSLNDLDLFSHVEEQNVVQDVHDVVNLLG